jgi:DNA-binding NtrC family response regulator
MSGESGMSVIDFAIRHAPDAICIMMTAYGEVDVAVEAMKRGAFDFLSKPVNLEKLDLLIMRGLNERKLKKENHDLHKRLDKTYSFDGILGKSQALEKVLEQVQLVGPSKATILVTGETGTGKELIAQAIHQNSDRSRGPLFRFIVPPYPPIYWRANYLGMKKVHSPEQWKNELVALNQLIKALYFSMKLGKSMLPPK